MKKWILFTFFLLLLPMGCLHEQKYSAQEMEQRIDSLWNNLTQLNGCLVGNQYERSGLWFTANTEGCVLHENEKWKNFFSFPCKDLTRFLVTRLDKVDETATHVCPYYLATEGELAVYALQMVHNKNWFDFLPFSGYDDTHTYSHRIDNPQKFLQEILSEPEACEQMEELWLALIK